MSSMKRPRRSRRTAMTFGPSAMPRRARSAALLVRQIRPSSRKRVKAVPALQHVVHGLGHVGMPRQPGALGPHPLLQVADERSNALPADGEPLRRTAGH